MLQFGLQAHIARKNFPGFSTRISASAPFGTPSIPTAAVSGGLPERAWWTQRGLSRRVALLRVLTL